jgi:hypothetical protein
MRIRSFNRKGEKKLRVCASHSLHPQRKRKELREAPEKDAIKELKELLVPSEAMIVLLFFHSLALISCL